MSELQALAKNVGVELKEILADLDAESNGEVSLLEFTTDTEEGENDEVELDHQAGHESGPGDDVRIRTECAVTECRQSPR